MKKSIIKTLNAKVKKREFTRITRKYQSKYSSKIETGIVYAFSRELLLLVKIEDFEIIETVIFPVQQIKKIRFNKNDRYYHHILVEEKVIDKIKLRTNPDLDSWRYVFRSLGSDCIIIETERSETRTFHIGGVTKVKKIGVSFLYFNAQGKLEKEPYFIKYKDITRLTLDSNYSEVFQRYVRKSDPM